MHAIQSITPMSDGTWLFTWTATSGPYRIVLFGQTISIVPSNTYTFDLPGYPDYPPPIEIVQETELADSEVNKPFLKMQWYMTPDASFYEVEELVDASWTSLFQIGEVGEQVYSYQTSLLVDGTSHSYRVTAFNSIEAGSNSREYQISVITQPNFVEIAYDVGYDSGAEEITIALV